jgi:hypothetical protein
VKESYQLIFEEYFDTGSQLTVYYKGKKVVDLWGSIPESLPTYSNNSLQRVFSSGKLVETLAVAICVDKGLFSLDDPIAKYWPGFAKHGKEQITIAQLMRHECGLAVLRTSVTLLELDAYTRGDPAPIARIIEESPPLWLNTTRRIYHAVTRGWIVAELIRRVDPQQRLFHEFVREEISEVLGIDIYFLPVGKVDNIVPLQQTPVSWVMGTILIQFCFGANLCTANVILPYYLDGLPIVPQIDEDLKNMMKIAATKNSPLLASIVFIHSSIDVARPTTFNQFYNYSLGPSFGTISFFDKHKNTKVLVMTC